MTRRIPDSTRRALAIGPGLAALLATAAGAAPRSSPSRPVPPSTFPTRTDAEASRIAVAARAGGIVTSGYARAGDGGGGRYRHAAAGAPAPGAFRSLDGAWWILDEPAANVRMFGALGDGSTDDRAAIQAAIDYSEILGCNVDIPPGDYLIGSVPGPDGTANGLLVPWGNVFHAKAHRSLVGRGRARLVAGADDMVILRLADTYRGVEGVLFDGGGRRGVTGLAWWPEDRRQTSLQVSQSQGWSRNCVFRRLAEGVGWQPGPTVRERPSGCFHYHIENATFEEVLVVFNPRRPADVDVNPEGYATGILVTGGSAKNQNCVLYADAVGDMDLDGFRDEHTDVAGPVTPPTVIFDPGLPAGARYTKNIRRRGGYSETAIRRIWANSPGPIQILDTPGMTPASGPFADAVSYTGRGGRNLNGGYPGAALYETVSSSGGYVAELDPANALAGSGYRWKLDGVQVAALLPWGRWGNTDVEERGAYHGFYSNDGANFVLRLFGQHASTPRGLRVTFPNAAPNNNAQAFAAFEDRAAMRCVIWSNGDLRNRNNVYGAISDRRLKTDIGDARGYLDDLMKLRVRKYGLKDDPEAGRQIGLIADEVAAVFPGLVSQSPGWTASDPEARETGEVTESVKYSVINLMLLRAIQELNLELKAMKDEIASLRSGVA